MPIYTNDDCFTNDIKFHNQVESINQNIEKLLSHENDIKSEIKNHRVARAIIGTDDLICTISIMPKPKNPNKSIKLFEEIEKLQGVMKK